MAVLQPGSLNPFGRVPKTQPSNFMIPLHHTAGLKSRGFGLGTCGRSTAGWFFDPNTQLFELAAANEERIEGKGLLIEPATTNYCLRNRELNLSPWLNSGTVQSRNEVGIHGASNIAWTLTDNSSGSSEYIRQPITITSNTEPQVYSIFIKKTVGASTFPGLRLYITGGPDDSLTVNTNTGGVTPVSGNTPDYYGADSYGDWWRVYITSINTNDTQAYVYIYPAVNTDAGDTWYTSTEGSVIVDMAQFERDKAFPTSPLVTTGSSNSRTTDAGLYTWPLPTAVSTMLADEGTMVCLITPGINNDVMDTDGGLVSCRNNVYSLLGWASAENGKVYSYDGTTWASSYVQGWEKGVTYIYAVRWGIGGTQFEIGRSGGGVSWAWGTASTFDGAYQLGANLTLGYSTLYPFHVKNIYFYDLLTQTQIEEMF